MDIGIGERIKTKRLGKAWTLDDLAKYALVSRQTIFKYENGIITNIPSDKIERIAKALGVSPAYLMGWDDAPPPIDAETLALAREIAGNPDMRSLLDAGRDASPDDMRKMVGMAKIMGGVVQPS